MPIVSQGLIKGSLALSRLWQGLCHDLYVTLQDVVWMVFYTMVALQWLSKGIRLTMFKLLSLSLWLVGDSHITTHHGKVQPTMVHK
jgi:hypothetical protein